MHFPSQLFFYYFLRSFFLVWRSFYYTILQSFETVQSNHYLCDFRSERWSTEPIQPIREKKTSQGTDKIKLSRTLHKRRDFLSMNVYIQYVYTQICRHLAIKKFCLQISINNNLFLKITPALNVYAFLLRVPTK